MYVEHDNPFATRFVRPGEVEFLESSTCQVEDVVSKYLKNGSIGQIVGPHGCGKTTLTFAMEKCLRKRFGKTRRLTIRRSPRFGSDTTFSLLRLPRVEFVDHDNRQTLPWNTDEISPLNRTLAGDSRISERELLIVDGIERLGILHQQGLVAACKRMCLGLLLTTHQPILNVKLLHRISPNEKTFRQIVERLLKGNTCSLGIEEHVIDGCFQQAGQNCREALMMLYDVVELQSVKHIPSVVESSAHPVS